MRTHVPHVPTAGLLCRSGIIADQKAAEHPEIQLHPVRAKMKVTHLPGLRCAQWIHGMVMSSLFR